MLDTTVEAPSSTFPTAPVQPGAPGYSDPGYTAPDYPAPGAPAPYTPAPTTPAPVVTIPRTTAPPATVATTSPPAPTTATFVLGVTASYFQYCDEQQGMKARPYLLRSPSSPQWNSTYTSCGSSGGSIVYYYRFSGVTEPAAGTTPVVRSVDAKASAPWPLLTKGSCILDITEGFGRGYLYC